ncbi:MAG: methyltransferase type 11, partial [Gammaproteobacteria bacterium]
MSSNTEPQVDLPEALFERIDPSDDGLFYSVPRMVTHIDDETIEMLTRYYAEVLPREGALLDLMSSCVSHLPPDREWPRIVGLGMNA